MRESLASHRSPGGPRAANPVWIWIVPALLLLAGVAIWFVLVHGLERRTVESTPVAVEPPPEPVADAAPRRPPVEAPTDIPPPPPIPEIPLPSLDESDPVLKGALTEFFGADVVEQYLKPDQLVRNLVVTVDNLPRPKLALDKRPVQPTPGVFATTGPNDGLVISAENYARYTPFVTLIGKSNARIIVGLYRGYYPLLQKAYEELGNPEPSFNTRLIEVIDDLLATPEVEQPVRLVQPNVLYEYADKKLESLSAGQKILIRMGPAHAATIKGKLREIRTELAAAPPALTGTGASGQ